MIFWLFKTLFLSIAIIYIIHVIRNYFSPNNDVIPSCSGSKKYDDIYKTHLDSEDNQPELPQCRKFRNKNSDVIDGEEIDDICTEADTQMKNELMDYVKEAAGQ